MSTVVGAPRNDVSHSASLVSIRISAARRRHEVGGRERLDRVHDLRVSMITT